MAKWQVFVPTGEHDEYFVDAATEDEAIIKTVALIDKQKIEPITRVWIEGQEPFALEMVDPQ